LTNPAVPAPRQTVEARGAGRQLFILGKQGLWPGRRWRGIQGTEEAIVEVRAILRERGVVSNRDFAMATRTRTQSYRGRKDSALALSYLWRVGEVMTHHRQKFERVYALTETVARASQTIIRLRLCLGGIQTGTQA
jgi:uncharacterized protein YcaQ